MLQRLLEYLDRQETNGLFTYSIVVADNHCSESAKHLVTGFAAGAAVPVKYCVEPQQNIALARNRALANAEGEFIAFIDDDEFPPRDWLLTLFNTCKAYDVAGVLGPVKPFFEQEPPRWLVEGKFYDRPTHETGHVLEWTDCRTGNVLFRRKILNRDRLAFRSEFGSGGEDRDFFRRMKEQGGVFVWCNEAAVYESVPPARWKRRFLLRRALLRGGASLANRERLGQQLMTSSIAIPTYAMALPFLCLAGHHVFMRYLIRLCDHAGRVLAALGIKPVREIYITE